MHVFQTFVFVFLFVFRNNPVTLSSLDILERFIIRGLHPKGDEWEDWPHKKTVVCLIYYSDNFQDIVIRHNDPHPKHPEEILIDYINSKLDKTKMKSITLYLNNSSCTPCSRKLQILTKTNPRIADQIFCLLSHQEAILHRIM